MALSKIKGTVIADDAINADRIEDGTVVASDILDNTITGGKLATDITISTTGSVTANTFSGDGSSLTALNISTDSTPQLGGNLDLNSNDITGTGNIDITGSGTFSGDLTVDTNTLYVDSTNNEVGIGTANPTDKLHIKGGNFDSLFVDNDGSQYTSIKIGNNGSENQSDIYWDNTGTSLNVRNRQSGFLGLHTGDVLRMTINTTETVVNDNSQDYDFRVESNNNSNMLFVDGGNDRVGIGTNSPQNTLHVDSSDGTIARFISSTSSGILQVGNSQTGTGTGPELRFHHNNALGSRIISESTEDFASAGNQSAKMKFNAKSNGNNYDMVTMVPGINGPLVGIGTTSPSKTLDVSGKAIITEASSGATADSSGDTLVIENSTHGGMSIFGGTNDSSRIFFGTSAEPTRGLIYYNHPNNYMRLTAASSTKMHLYSSEVVVNEDSNDLDFRVESDSNTHALFVEGSSDRVGIGTSSPTEALDIRGSATTLQYDNDAANGPAIQTYHNSASPADNDVIGRLRFFAKNSASEKIEYAKVDVATVDVTDATEDSLFAFYTMSNGLLREKLRMNEGGTVVNEDSRDFDFRVESDTNTHALFVDGGNDAVLFGKSAYNAIGTVGVEIRSSIGLGIFTRNNGQPIIFNREGTDGQIVDCRKDQSVIGGLGSNGGDLTIGTGDTGLRFNDGGDFITPYNFTNVSDRDNAIDLGTTGVRFDDIYATNGTIQTSDQNEKQSIQSLTSSEIAVAQRISKLFKTFKFNSAVEEKGDSARTHTGIIAQDVQQAFTDEGLDASNYALFISSTWWENEEGDIKEEATEGYTERTRLGIRYPELLSFVSSAFEQRLTNIETRLTALET